MSYRPQETFQTAVEAYEKYLFRQRVSWAIFTASYFGSFLAFFALSTGIGVSVVITVTLLVGGLLISLVAAVFRFRYSGLRRNVFSREQRALYYLKPSVQSLDAYMANRKNSFKNNALKKLRVAADVIDGWNVGNLTFLQNSVGEKVKLFQTLFRGRLISNVEKADAGHMKLPTEFLRRLSDAILFGGVDEQHLEIWNKSLSQFEPAKPEESLLQTLRSKMVWYHVAYVSAVLVGAYAYWSFLRNYLGDDVNTATTGFSAILGIFLTPYAVLVVGRYLMRERDSKEKAP